MLKRTLKPALLAANRAADALLCAGAGHPAPRGHLHIINGGIGDALFMLPYYKRLFDKNPCERILCVESYNTALFQKVFPNIAVEPFDWQAFCYNPFYRMKFNRGHFYEYVSAEFPFDPDTLASLSFFRAQRLIAAAIRSDEPAPPIANLEVVRNPAAPLGHLAAFGQLYFSRLWSMHSQEPFPPPPGPAEYRALLRAAFASLPTEPFARPGEEYICIANTPTRAYRSYPQQHWQRIIDALPRGAKILHLGAQNLPLDHPGYRDLGGATTLPQALALILNARLFIGVETGLLHAAYMGGVRTVCILGGGHYGHYLPWDAFSDNLKCAAAGLPCAGCDWHCRYVNLERNEKPPCITGIGPEQAIGLIEEFGKL